MATIEASTTVFDNIRQYLLQEIVYDGGGRKWEVELILLAGVAVAAVACYFLTKLLLELVRKIVDKTTNKWDNDLLDEKMLRAVSQLTPALVINWLLPGVFKGFMNDVRWLQSLTSIYIVATVVFIIWVFIGTLHDSLEKRENLSKYAIKGIFQTFQLIDLFTGIIIAVSILIGKSPVVILTALGACAAVLILIFQDTILGLVASVQFSANKMLQKGDWIEDKTHDVNGEVLEVTLSAVKIQNWDNSTSCVPPYLLLKNSFRNYQPMRESGGRRVDRSIYIDMNSVGFCDSAMLAHLHDEGFITGHELEERAINLTLFRHYLERYLTSHEKVNSNMLLMIRQLQCTGSGLPLELYFFTTAVEWESYERVVCDIFDHVYAVVNEFGLRIFQTPAGVDLERASSKKITTK